MRIAFVITRGDAVGGATVHVRDLARTLIGRGHEASVIIGGKGDVVDELNRFQIPVRHVSCLQRQIDPARDPIAVIQIARALREIQPDLVSTHTAKAGLLGRVAAKLVGVPAIFTPHGWAISDRISPVSGRIFRIAERAAAPLASSIVNVCEAEKRLAEEHRIAADDRLAVIHNGVVDVPASLLAKPATEPPRLVMVARFEPPKDHDVLFRALAEAKHLDWSLELIGGGPGLAEAQAQAESLGLTKRLEFRGAASNVAERMAGAQLFVLTTRSEGFPRSILEAMRAGLPVVASDVGGVAEAVAHGTSGIVVPRGEVRPLADALITLIGSPALRAKFGHAGRQRYEAQFTFESMFEKTFDLYERVLASRLRAVPAHLGEA